MFEVVVPPVGSSGNPLLSDEFGNVAEVAGISRDERNGLILSDKEGKTIKEFDARSMLQPNTTAGGQSAIARKLTVGGQTVFIDSTGNEIQTEVGQADDSYVLMSTHGSLVYYITIVNDVFAYMRTGAMNGGITPEPSQFPTTQNELDKIIAFASARGKTFPDSDALAVELKTSWVDATNLPNLDTYITIDATIPAFDQFDNKKWIANGQQKVKLAMVGMHVVGSAAGHPEMIWATFEHVANSPVAPYSFLDIGDNRKNGPQPTSGPWLFSRSNAGGPFNEPHMKLNGNSIEALDNFNVSQSDTLRLNAWGSAFGVSPNPIDCSDTVSNTQMISINNSIRKQLANGDVRANYILIGATWADGGTAPSPINQFGTSMLVNSTIETYRPGTNCFTCHRTNQTMTSHVYRTLVPLF
jgi:hypothetical protein